MKKRNAFTLVELLVVISIIALLVGILLPALSRARDAAMVNSSKNNIRNIYMANQNYNAAWKGRQFVGAPSNLGKFGNTAGECIQNYLNNIGAYGGAYGGEMFDGWAPGPGVQFGETQGGTVVFPGNVPEYIIPYLWESGPCSTTSGAARYGTHMHPNARQIAEYMEDQIVNKAYFAPKDVIVLDGLKDCFSSQGNLCPGVKGEWGGDFGSFGIDEFGGYGWGPAIPYVSYIYSPANMFNPRVFQYKGDATPGFTDPCTFNSGFQAPTLDQSKYASLKGYLIESHWLQNVTGENCSPTWDNLPTSGTLAWRNTPPMMTVGTGAAASQRCTSTPSVPPQWPRSTTAMWTCWMSTPVTRPTTSLLQPTKLATEATTSVAHGTGTPQMVTTVTGSRLVLTGWTSASLPTPLTDPMAATSSRTYSATSDSAV